MSERKKRYFSPESVWGRAALRDTAIFSILKNHHPATNREIHELLRQLPTFLGVGSNDVNSSLSRLRDRGCITKDRYDFWTLVEEDKKDET